jgi:hypothetical protein
MISKTSVSKETKLLRDERMQLRHFTCLYPANVSYESAQVSGETGYFCRGECLTVRFVRRDR